MTEFINHVLANQYVQILLSAIQFIGWGGIATFIVTIVSWRRKLKRKIDNDMLKKDDLSELAQMHESTVKEVDRLKEELNRQHEYNVLTSDAVILLVLSSRRIDGATKLSIAKRAQMLADNEAVKKAAEAAIAAIPKNSTSTEEDDDMKKNNEYADNTDELLQQLTSAGGNI